MNKKALFALGVVGIVGGSTYLILNKKEEIKAFFDSANRDLTSGTASGGSAVNQVGVNEKEVQSNNEIQQVDQSDLGSNSILNSGSSNENVLSTMSFGDAKISYDYSKASSNNTSNVDAVNVPVSIKTSSGESKGHAVVPKSILGKSPIEIKSNATPLPKTSSTKSNFGSKIKNIVQKASKVAKIGTGNSVFSKIKSVIKKEK